MKSDFHHPDYKAFKTSGKRRSFTQLYLILFGAFLGVMLTIYLSPGQNTTEKENHIPDIVKTQTPSTSVSSFEQAVIEATKKAMPAVVTVFTTGSKVRLYRFNHPLLDMLWGPQTFREPVTGMASGVIVDPDGTIYTNDHVIDVENAKNIKVVLTDGRSFEAKLVKRFLKQDIAILSINGENLPYLETGSSGDVLPGQTVLAIGNPFGAGLTEGLSGGEPTVTRGIISATKRILTISQGNQTRFYRNMLQTDASINEGNSGGALIDLNGRLIGINTAIYEKGGGSIGIGFAIPTDRIKLFLESSEKYGDINKWAPGIQIQPLTNAVAEALNYHGDGGAVVSRINPGGAGDKSGLKRGDIIIGINGFNVTNTNEVRSMFNGFITGETLTLTVFRKNENLEIDLTLEHIQ